MLRCMLLLFPANNYSREIKDSHHVSFWITFFGTFKHHHHQQQQQQGHGVLIWIILTKQTVITKLITTNEIIQYTIINNLDKFL